MLSAAFAVLTGACLYLFFVQHYALNQLDRSIKIAEISSSKFVYGVVRSVDVSQKIIILSMRDPFADTTRDLKVTLADEAYIARQDLEPIDGPVFTSISSPLRGNLTDLTPGTHVAVDLKIKTSEGYQSDLILYGNPL